MLVYRIVDWEKHFENNRTRELKNLLWIALPTKLDGDGYTELVEGKDGAAIYGAWVACVIVASRCDPRGTLLRDGARPHNSESLARITRLPKCVFDAMLEKAQRVGWIETYDDPAHSCENLAPSCLTGRENRENRENSTEQEIQIRGFDLFWAAYPMRNGRKVGKKKALQQWKKIETKKHEEVIAATKNYSSECNGYPKDAERYLRDKVWRDYLTPKRVGPRPLTDEELQTWTPE